MTGGPSQRLAMRVLLAVFAGYALASAVAVVLPSLLPMPRAQAVLAATLLGFVEHLMAALWVFTEPDLRRVAAGLLLPAVLLTTLGLALQRTGT